MAVTKQNNQKKRSSATKRPRKQSSVRSSGRKKKSPDGGLNPKLKTEIILLIAIAVCILLFLSNLGLGGRVGGWISSFFFGVFGICAYIFPILLFLGGIFYYVNKDNSLIYRKLIGGTAFYLLLCAFMHITMVGVEKGSKIGSFYTEGSISHIGGGLIGGMIVKIVSLPFGTIFTYVFLTIGMIIAAIIATQRPFIEPIRESGTKVLNKTKEHHKLAVLEREERLKKNTPSSNQDELNQDFILKLDDMDDEHCPSLFDMTDLKGSKRKSISNVKQEKLKFDSSKDMTEQALTNENESSVKNGEVPDSALGDEKEAASGNQKRRKRSSKEEVREGIASVSEEIKEGQDALLQKAYVFPPLDLLSKGQTGRMGDSGAHLKETAIKLQQTLHNFGVNVAVTNVSCGPSVTRYEIQPEQGVKVSKIVGLTDDIKLNLAAADIRIEAPIPGKAAVGIEVPNATNSPVHLRDLLATDEFSNFKSDLAFAVGKDIGGKTVITDIAKMPHLLIAGATGSGKSVCINTLIMSVLYKADPKDVKFIMIDPKVVELSVYNGIPHLFIPIVTDPKKAAGALNWAVAEMTDRYNKFADLGVRDLSGYNKKVKELKGVDKENELSVLPQIIIIVDELADLMMVAPGEVEDAICRLAQLARAAGIHLIIATQRPSVNVITGLIKANMPSRIAFSVSSGVDSRTILDMNGAEKLLGKGDMLFYPQGYQKPARLQGSFVSDKEIHSVVTFLKEHSKEEQYDTRIQEEIEKSSSGSMSPGGVKEPESDNDVLFTDAGRFIIEKDKASIGMLQRMFKIGFNRAARIMDQLSEAGVVGPEEGTKPRKVLMTLEQFDQFIEEMVL